MATGTIIGQRLVAVGSLTDIDGPTSVSSSNGLGQRNPLGSRFQDANSNEYIYLVGVASTAAGDWVSYVPGTFVTARFVDSLTGMVAVAMAATIASCWGWYQIFGLTPATTNIATDGSADQKPLYRSATAGRASTTAAGTKAIFGAVAVGASASNVGTAQIAYPFNFGNATV